MPKPLLGLLQDGRISQAVLERGRQLGGLPVALSADDRGRGQDGEVDQFSRAVLGVCRKTLQQ